ncbi:MAG: class I SAM-dependent methyltransferase [Meiothermus sp.]
MTAIEDQRKRLPITLAARSNLLAPTAWGYELWRSRALSQLSGRRFTLEEELAQMTEAVQPVPGSIFLDLGTSTGLYARALLSAGAAKVYGLDLSPAMLKEAVRRSREFPGFTPLLARAEAIPLPADSLDGVVVGGSWNEFRDLEVIVKEMQRVLKPGGRLWMMFTHRSKSSLQRLLERTGLHFPTTEEVVSLLKRYDFRVRGWSEKSVGFVTGTMISLGE